MASELKPVIRKIVTHHETSLIEGGKIAEPPLHLFAAAAVIKNPWLGRGFVEDLSPEIYAYGPVMGELLTNEILNLAARHAPDDPGDAIEGYGKAAIVGVDGEVEHASGLIHTLRFGNTFRKAVGAKSYLSFTNTRNGPNAPVVIPLMHKHDAGMRSHYLTIQFQINDAPAADEVVVALGGSVGGRPHHRIGDRYKDLEELGGTDV